MPVERTKRFRNLLRGDGVSMGLWSCSLANLDDGPEQHSDLATINVPLQGAFIRRGSTGTELVDPLTCSFSNAGEVWCTRHPSPCRDTGIYVLLERLDAPFVVTYRRLTARAWLDWRLLAGLVENLPRDNAVDAVLLLVDRVTDAEPTYAGSELARDARACLDRGDVRSVDALARQLGVSPFVLCRAFRRSTGVTAHAWLDQLRAIRAADAILGGAQDLASLALELGFSHHSHLSARVRKVFGCTPSQLRRLGRKDVTAAHPALRLTAEHAVPPRVFR